MKSQFDPLNKNKVLTLLDREPKTPLKVIKKCCHGYPVVILNELIDYENKPFPTMFWLTCPELNKKISKLESSGKIKEIKKKIDGDEELSIEFKEAQVKFVNLKKHILKKKDKSRLSDAAREKLETSGITGSKSGSIKCLHAHYAHYLIMKNNPVGRIVDSMIETTVCEKECEKS